MAKDFIINEDIEIANGDFVIEDSEQQHVQHILNAAPGNYYQYPTLGVDIQNEAGNNSSTEMIKRLIKKNLEDDNYKVTGLIVEFDQNGELKLQLAAERKK